MSTIDRAHHRFAGCAPWRGSAGTGLDGGLPLHPRRLWRVFCLAGKMLRHDSALYAVPTLRTPMQRRACLCATALLALASVSPLRAAPDVTAADAKAVRSVIEAQLAAFAADDADKAFSFAAPNVRTFFVSADRFL